jgi:hypothetical protein
MKTFKRLVKLLGSVKKTSKQIISKSLVIMKKLTREDIYLVEDLVENAKGESRIVTPEKALELLRETVTSWTLDSSEILKEIDQFVVGDGESFKINAECEFLYEVWNGDMYDKTGVEGLEELLKELTSRLENLDDEHLIEEAMKKIPVAEKSDTPKTDAEKTD